MAKIVKKKVVKSKPVKQEKVAAKQITPKFELPTLEELLAAGAHFGHSVKRRNPRMDQYVYSVHGGVQVFDLVKTRECLERACAYLSEQASQGEVLVLGTKAQAVDAVRTKGQELKTPYIVNRWVGGLFTNWTEIKKRIDKLTQMKAKTAAGEYKKYTKKEQVLLAREIERLDRLFGGVEQMKELPKALVIIDPNRETTAVREALAVGVPIVAVADTNANPQGLEIVVPANDDSHKTVTILVNTLMNAIDQGIARRGK